MKLPKYVVLKSIHNNKYLQYDEQDGLLQFSGDNPKSPYSKFEVLVQNKSGSTLVHLKCCISGTYWSRRSDHEWWISASGRKREEDRTRWSCTLFEPVSVDPLEEYYEIERSTVVVVVVVVRFLHVQLKHYACLFPSREGPFCDSLYAASDVANRDLSDACAVIDWDSLSSNATSVEKRVPRKPYKLPRFIAMKSRYNHKYLRYINDDDDDDQNGYLKFSADKPTSLYAKFEVEMAASGGGLVHLKCWVNDKYLARQSRSGWWIRGEADRPEENRSKWNCTLFRPEIMSSGDGESAVVRFRHVQLGHYACLFNTSGDESLFKDCLYAGWEVPTKNLYDVVTIVDLDYSVNARPRLTRKRPPLKEVVAPDQDDDVESTDDEDDDDDGHQSDIEDILPAQRRRFVEDDDIDRTADDAEIKPVKKRAINNIRVNKIRRTQVDPVDKVNSFLSGFETPDRKEKCVEKEFTIVSSANDYWGAIFAFTEILPKAVPNYYSKINAVKGNGFSEGSIREITFFQGVPLKTSDEQIIYVDHETKTVTWSVINGGMKDFYDILKITVSVEPKIKTRPRDYGCIVKWRCEAHGENSKGLNMKSMKQFVKKTFDTLDTYLLRSVVSETR